MTLQELIAQTGITATSEQVDHNPNMADDSWARTADHYRVTLTRRKPRRQLTTFFSMGSAIGKPPTAEEVLDSLASDAEGCEQAIDFEDWASGYGYDTDSRKAEHVYRTVKCQARKLQRFMDSAYIDLLDAERL